MAILNNLDETAEQSEYKFTDGKIDDFITELGQEKQDMGIDFEPEIEDEEEEPEIEEEEQANINITQARAMSKGLVIGADSLISGLMGMFNKGDNEPFKLTEEERTQVTESLAIVLKHKQTNINPTWGLVILLLSIYGGKSLTLVQLRKEEKKNKELETKVQNLERQIEWNKEQQN